MWPAHSLRSRQASIFACADVRRPRGPRARGVPETLEILDFVMSDQVSNAQNTLNTQTMQGGAGFVLKVLEASAGIRSIAQVVAA